MTHTFKINIYVGPFDHEYEISYSDDVEGYNEQGSWCPCIESITNEAGTDIYDVCERLLRKGNKSVECFFKKVYAAIDKYRKELKVWSLI